MLCKVIVNSFKILIEVVLWISLIASVIAGWQGSIALGGHGGGMVGALKGFAIWFIMVVVFLGIPLLLVDIRDRIKRIELSKE